MSTKSISTIFTLLLVSIGSCKSAQNKSSAKGISSGDTDIVQPQPESPGDISGIFRITELNTEPGAKGVSTTSAIMKYNITFSNNLSGGAIGKWSTKIVQNWESDKKINEDVDLPLYPDGQIRIASMSGLTSKPGASGSPTDADSDFVHITLDEFKKETHIKYFGFDAAILPVINKKYGSFEVDGETVNFELTPFADGENIFKALWEDAENTIPLSSEYVSAKCPCIVLSDKDGTINIDYEELDFSLENISSINYKKDGFRTTIQNSDITYTTSKKPNAAGDSSGLGEFEPIKVDSAVIDPDTNEFVITHGTGGGCGEHEYKLQIESCLESLPPQCGVSVLYRTNDHCEAMIVNERRFLISDYFKNPAEVSFSGNNGSTFTLEVGGPF
ncbi:MAG: hypothetical protein KBD78_13450 [Oligoflexales bacterium]|nr:hypothetical protein [Oligoflexales bacterium]